MSKKIIAKFGVEIEGGFNFNVPRGWTSHGDGSVRIDYDDADYVGEYVSPPIPWENRKEGLNTIKKFDGGDYLFDNSCGYHVHLSFTRNLYYIMLNSTAFIKEFERAAVQKFPELKKRLNNQYAREANKDDAPQKRFNYITTRYRAVNIDAINRHGTIEFRIFPATDGQGMVTYTKWLFKFVRRYIMRNEDKVKKELAKMAVKNSYFAIEPVVSHGGINLQISIKKQLIGGAPLRRITPPWAVAFYGGDRGIYRDFETFLQKQGSGAHICHGATYLVDSGTYNMAWVRAREGQLINIALPKNTTLHFMHSYLREAMRLIRLYGAYRIYRGLDNLKLFEAGKESVPYELEAKIIKADIRAQKIRAENDAEEINKKNIAKKEELKRAEQELNGRITSLRERYNTTINELERISNVMIATTMNIIENDEQVNLLIAGVI